MDTEIKSDKKKLNKKYWQFFWRSWFIQASWNYERQMNMGFMYGIAPTIDALYGDSPEEIERKKKHIDATWPFTTVHHKPMPSF